MNNISNKLKRSMENNNIFIDKVTYYCDQCDNSYCSCKHCSKKYSCDPCGDADYRDTFMCPNYESMVYQLIEEDKVKAYVYDNVQGMPQNSKMTEELIFLTGLGEIAVAMCQEYEERNIWNSDMLRDLIIRYRCQKPKPTIKE